MTADVCAYRRFMGPNLAVDSRWEMISPLACRHLAGVWVNALNRGDYVRIEFRLTDGSIVIVKKLKPKRNVAKEIDDFMKARLNTEISDEHRQRLECRESR